VTLHVYSVGQSTSLHKINNLLQVCGTGAYHVAVEVNGAEWSYGYAPRGSGVFDCKPGACKTHIYREKVDLGYTTLSKDEVRSILQEMHAEYLGADYDLLRKNCCSFSSDFVIRLDLPPIPSWALNLANTGKKAVDMFYTVFVCMMEARVCCSLTLRFLHKGNSRLSGHARARNLLARKETTGCVVRGNAFYRTL